MEKTKKTIKNPLKMLKFNKKTKNNKNFKNVFSRENFVLDKKNLLIFVIVIGLGIFGCLMVYSASSYMAQHRYGNPFFYLTKQIVGVVLGAVAMLVFSKIDYHKLTKLKWPLVIVSAILLPQLIHLMGRISGMGTTLGVALLPMHLPIILVGILAGAYAGGIAGVLSPLASFTLTGMPMAANLPFMMVELGIYGITAGVLRNSKMPVIAKVVISQLAGRIFYAIAITLAIYAFGNTNLVISSAWSSTTTGIFGIVLQLTLIPLITYRVKN